MNKFILGQKDRMTQIFDEEGKVVPTTVINIAENVVTQTKTEQNDGYNSVQLATGEKKEKNLTKAQKGHLGKAFRFVKEFRLKEEPELKKGDVVTLEGFEVGDKITISSVSKGKGFQGGVKRYNFSGGRRSHGNKHAEREVGSIGAGTTPGRVWKGKKMPGRMGSDRITVKNLKIVKIDNENNRIFVKGAVAGKAGDLVEIVKN
ncbi:50S ribosomal protein L3 [Candidatus Campbellbacteria bacterium]|nr:MAG: 50S ribosomal protein L3 [Candidatus Campbellbacteria bacterium]